MFSIISLTIVLLLVLIMPFMNKFVERNLEIFLFIMGLSASLVSGVLGKELVLDIFTNKFIYLITLAVFISGLVFKSLKYAVKNVITGILKAVPFKLLVFGVIVLLGLLSSVITAIIASLLLVEIANSLPVDRKMKINIVILSCFSIGLGAALTPVGEPLATVVVSRLGADFTFLLAALGGYIIPGILALGILGAVIVKRELPAAEVVNPEQGDIFENAAIEIASEISVEEETYQGIVERTVKVFVFVMALELLGTGFKPLIDQYVISINGHILYWLNMISAILDNATLASAEISTKMSSGQILAVLMGLLISGGMLIPGNIPNIISAGKLKIGSKEWARAGIPLGLCTMAVFYGLIFFVFG